ncbi:glucose dehydrogenase [Paenibacillus sp. PastH-3]|nr:glucose dehydrogenase [Paenibacillus sp. PastH-4]MDH6442255.1 glucose dehydrogenase [Paenibacillus sp. PastF-4]MDH6527032.1 glucose dehydrogenase [Paenibacillus sp. PastH-3]
MFLVIGIVFSIGGGSLFVTHYDSLFFYSAVLLLCIVSYLWFIKHLFEKKLELLLLICVGTTMLFFFLTGWLN